MADISIATNYPLSPSVFDVVAETARIAAQIMRNNPMENSVVTRGLIKWLGHYPGNPLWIGEFNPADPNLLGLNGKPLPQRGFALRRDDPTGATALALYDWGPVAGHPLRQRMWSSDADNRITWKEGESGGWGWPRYPVPMYSAPYLWTTTNSDSVRCFGRSQFVGRHLDWMFSIAMCSLGTVTTAEYGGVLAPLELTGPTSGAQISYYLEVDVGSTVITSPTLTSGPGFISGTLDLKAAWMPEPSAYLSDYLAINLHAWLSNSGAAPGSAFSIQPLFVHNYTAWTDRVTEGF